MSRLRFGSPIRTSPTTKAKFPVAALALAASGLACAQQALLNDRGLFDKIDTVP